MAIKLSALFTCIVAHFYREESKGCAGAIKDVAHVVGAKVVTLPQKGSSPNVSAAFREVMQKATAELDYLPQRPGSGQPDQRHHGGGWPYGQALPLCFGQGEHHETGLRLLMDTGFHLAQQEREAIELLIARGVKPRRGSSKVPSERKER